MAELLRILIVDRSPATPGSVTRLLVDDSSLRVIGAVDSAAGALQAVAQGRPDVVLLDVGLSDMDAIALTERLGERSPTTAVVMTSDKVDGDYVRRAMLAGARGFLVKPLDGAELVLTLRRIQHDRDRRTGVNSIGPSAAHDAGTRPGRVVAVFAPKGGVGRTTIAVNLAVAAAERAKTVALVDASVQFGDVGLLLNVKPSGASIADLIGDLGEGQPDAVDAALVSHQSGVRVLLAPPGPETAELIKPEHYLATIKRLGETHQLVVVDCGPLLEDVTLAILDTADVILCMTSLDLSSIKNMRLFMVVADRIGYGPDKLKIVLNRADSPHGIDLNELEQSIGRPVDFSIVSDGRAALRALNTGVPFTANNKSARISRDVAAIAAAIMAGPAPDVVEKPARQVPTRRLSLARR